MASSRISGTNENISTYGVLATPRDYDVLADWEAFSDYDLVTATTSEVLECYADAASYADTVTMDGATTNSSYFRIIRPATGEGHNGTPNTGIIFTSTTSGFNLSEGYASVYDIAVSLNGNSASNLFVFDATDTGSPNKRIVGCIAFDSTNAGAGTITGFITRTDQAYVANCLALRIENDGFRANASLTNTYSNCTAIDCDRGFRNDGTTTAVYKNCLAHSNTTADFSNAGTTTGSTNNASSDATAFGTLTYLSQTFTFVDAANDDFHLHRNDLGAKFRGTDLSADTFPFNDDIDGDTITNWSIGFHAEETTQSSRRTGDNENISTFAASGADYSAITDWEAFTDNDLVTAVTSEVLECADGTYTDGLALAGATTDGRYFRIIRRTGGAVHGGVPTAGVIFSGTGVNHWDVAEAFAQIQDITVISAGNSAGIVSACRTNGGSRVTFVGVMAKATNAGAGNAHCFTAGSSSLLPNFVHCVAYESDQNGFFLDGSSVKAVLNCNAVNNGTNGFIRSNTTVHAVNCLGDGNLTADFSGTFSSSTNYNAATDATTTGANSRNNQIFSYLNDAGNNYHLVAKDTGALGFGISMAVSPIYNYIDDIDGFTVVDWSIGFDSDAHAHRKVDNIRLMGKVHGALT